MRICLIGSHTRNCWMTGWTAARSRASGRGSALRGYSVDVVDFAGGARPVIPPADVYGIVY